jgi:large subunit ribosomal protein L10
MATAEKIQYVDALTESIKASSGVYLADFTGIKVGAVTQLRSELRKKGITMRVAKNTLIKRAFQGAGVEGLDELLAGPSSLILADGDDPMAPAKLIVEFLKKEKDAIKMKAVHMDGGIYPGEQLVDLSKMPGKRELQAQVVSLAMGPSGKLLGILKGPGSALASQIQALVERLESGESN